MLRTGHTSAAHRLAAAAVRAPGLLLHNKRRLHWHGTQACCGCRVRQRARLEVMLVKGERFNEIIAQERAEQQALKAGRGTKSQQANQPQPRSQASASRADAAVSWRNVNNPDAAPLEDGDIGPLAESTASILEAGESRPNSNRRSSDSRRQTATRTAEQAAHESVSQKPRHRS